MSCMLGLQQTKQKKKKWSIYISCKCWTCLTTNWKTQAFIMKQTPLYIYIYFYFIFEKNLLFISDPINVHILSTCLRNHLYLKMGGWEGGRARIFLVLFLFPFCFHSKKYSLQGIIASLFVKHHCFVVQLLYINYTKKKNSFEKKKLLYVTIADNLLHMYNI